MIICPNCKEEIDDDSRYCDQCGQALLYCVQCGRPGMGRRCISCGSLMMNYDDLMKNRAQNQSSSVSNFMSQNFGHVTGSVRSSIPIRTSGIPQLTLRNDSLNIHLNGIDGAIIGRRQGPYHEMFSQYGYVSGVHAQLTYSTASGWCITDKHSSNGTKLNNRQLQPDVPMSINNGDIINIANVVLEVSIY